MDSRLETLIETFHLGDPATIVVGIAVVIIALIYTAYTYLIAPSAFGSIGSLSDEELDYFLRLVKKHLGAKGIKVRIKGGFACLEGRGLAGIIDLAPLADRCYEVGQEQWPMNVARYFERAGESYSTYGGMGASGDGSMITQHLSVRIYDRDSINVLGRKKIITGDDSPAGVSVLVFEHAGLRFPVTVKESRSWGFSAPELFQIGLDNARSQSVDREEEEEEGDGETGLIFDEQGRD